MPIPAVVVSRDGALTRLHVTGNAQPTDDQIAAETQQQVCRSLRKQIDAASSQAEQDAGRAKITPATAEQVKYWQDRATLFPQALAEVYEQGKDRTGATWHSAAGVEHLRR